MQLNSLLAVTALAAAASALVITPGLEERSLRKLVDPRSCLASRPGFMEFSRRPSCNIYKYGHLPEERARVDKECQDLCEALDGAGDYFCDTTVKLCSPREEPPENKQERKKAEKEAAEAEQAAAEARNA